MPDKSTVFLWLGKHPEFVDQYARAKEESADTHADDILEISDDGSNDWMERHAKDSPGWVVNGEHIQRSRLRVEARKWIASKLKPKKYGDKVAIGGASDLPPVQVQEIVIRAVDATGD